MKSPRQDKLLLTPDAAAEILSISPRTLWALTRQGQLPCLRIGRLVRYEPQDLQDWVRRKKETNSSEFPRNPLMSEQNRG